MIKIDLLLLYFRSNHPRAPSFIRLKISGQRARPSRVLIRDKMALKIVVNAIKQDQLPIEVFYRVWKISEGQLSWIIHSLKHPDIFCLADYQSKRISTESLKAQPEDDNRLIASWRSLGLIDMLLNLSETGAYSNCIEPFKFPIIHCPDLLLLGLLQLFYFYKTIIFLFFYQLFIIIKNLMI